MRSNRGDHIKFLVLPCLESFVSLAFDMEDVTGVAAVAERIQRRLAFVVTIFCLDLIANAS